MNTSHSIGIFHYQLGLTDGVSLEVEKWKTVLERIGHQVQLFAGRFGADQGILVPELYHHTAIIEEINHNVLGLSHSLTSKALGIRISEQKDKAKAALKKAIVDNGLDLLIVDNIWSVAMNIPAAIALREIQSELDLHAIAHHHDFYWEKRVKPDLGDPLVKEILDNDLPPNSADIKHVVINSLAQASLAGYKGLESTIIPNVFDFQAPDWVIDSYNQDFRQAIGLKEGDICVLQATRIIPRKGIELAIDLVAALNATHRRALIQERCLANGGRFTPESKIVLVLAGYNREDLSGTYLQRLKEKADSLGVDLRHIDTMVGPERSRASGKKIYSFWDTYTIADLVTYPSLWEGWGNQLLEAFRAKLPVVLFEYPVYLEDIKDKGFEVISLGSVINSRDRLDLAEISTKILQGVADKCVDYLTDRQMREQLVDKNYRLAKQHYSYETLENDLLPLL